MSFYIHLLFSILDPERHPEFFAHPQRIYSSHTLLRVYHDEDFTEKWSCTDCSNSCLILFIQVKCSPADKCSYGRQCSWPYHIILWSNSITSFGTLIYVVNHIFQCTDIMHTVLSFACYPKHHSPCVYLNYNLIQTFHLVLTLDNNSCLWKILAFAFQKTTVSVNQFTNYCPVVTQHKKDLIFNWSCNYINHYIWINLSLLDFGIIITDCSVRKTNNWTIITSVPMGSDHSYISAAAQLKQLGKFVCLYLVSPCCPVQ